jgi:hypothetical protein
VRIPTSLFSDLSDIILNFKRYITSDFARKPRTLFEVDRFKATEFRQLLLYTGVVALKDILSDDQYHNFLHLSCAIRILITPDVCIALNECAQNMLYDFVVSFGEIYGKEFITYNVHNLIHLPSDVKNFGCLDNFSAFPAESHMFQIKQKICIQSGKPLQQLIKRLSEQDAKLNKTNNSGNLNMKKDYIEIKCKTFTLSNKQPNNVCLLKNGKFLRITNILKKDGLIYVTGQYLKLLSSFFKQPIDSINLGIYLCSLEDSSDSLTSSFAINHIFCKVMVLPFKELFVTLPIAHSHESQDSD